MSLAFWYSVTATDEMDAAEGPKVQNSTSSAPRGSSTFLRGSTNSPERASNPAEFTPSPSEAIGANASNTSPAATDTQNNTTTKANPIKYAPLSFFLEVKSSAVDGNASGEKIDTKGLVTNSEDYPDTKPASDTQAEASRGDALEPYVWPPYDPAVSYEALLERPTPGWAVKWETGKLHLLGLVPGQFYNDIDPDEVPNFMQRTGRSGFKHSKTGKIELPNGEWAIYTILARVGQMSKAAIHEALVEWLGTKSKRDGTVCLPFSESTVRTYLSRHDDVFTQDEGSGEGLNTPRRMGLWRLRRKDEHAKEKGKGGALSNKTGSRAVTTTAALAPRSMRISSRAIRADKPHSIIHDSSAEEEQEPQTEEAETVLEDGEYDSPSPMNKRKRIAFKRRTKEDQQRPRKTARKGICEEGLELNITETERTSHGQEEQPDILEVTSPRRTRNSRRPLPTAPLRPQETEYPYGLGIGPIPWSTYRPRNPRAAYIAERDFGSAEFAYLVKS
ncbi:hypothetical protein BDZ45DRAFT_723600 [Acephala macrosclerotiorum]|nr:hypothetical protein BDZ45DRAFT_723600 [Acephala macrosclerotiorum]